MTKTQSDIFHVSDWKAYQACLETGEPFTPTVRYIPVPMNRQAKEEAAIYQAIIASKLSAIETARVYDVNVTRVYTYWKEARLAGLR